jgi:hypothetical protein
MDKKTGGGKTNGIAMIYQSPIGMMITLTAVLTVNQNKL